MTVDKCWGNSVSIILVFLIVMIIVILLFKKFALNITQQQNCPPQKEKQPLIVRFVNSIYITIKVTIEFSFKIVLPGAFILGIVKYTGLDDVITSYLKQCVHAVCDIKDQPMDYMNGKAIYDTDPDMDTYIKGDLNAQQFGKFDKVLACEKKQYGSRVSATDVQRLAASDPAVVDAYTRWLQCKSLNRSSFHVVYPDERKSHR